MLPKQFDTYKKLHGSPRPLSLDLLDFLLLDTADSQSN